MQRLILALHEDNVPHELIALIKTILAASKEISFRVSQGQLSGLMGSTLDENIQGEIQKELDVFANEIIKDALIDSAYVKAISSEEENTSVAGNPEGEYIVSFDPLDGSSNIEINGLIGTIFSIHPAPKNICANDAKIFMQPGTKQVCAGYVIYGPATILVMTTGKGTHLYVLDNTHGGFIQVEQNIKIPENTNEFAINMANQRFWQDPMQHYVRDLIAGTDGHRSKDFNMRWVGAMVGDVHRVLTRGGIFVYPSDSKKSSQPNKLRLMYEASPMSFLVEQAGGISTSNQGRVMDITPNDIHQRVEVILGSKNEVNKCLSYY